MYWPRCTATSIHIINGDVVLIIMSNLSKAEQGVWHKESGVAAGSKGETMFLEAVKKKVVLLGSFNSILRY